MGTNEQLPTINPATNTNGGAWENMKKYAGKAALATGLGAAALWLAGCSTDYEPVALENVEIDYGTCFGGMEPGDPLDPLAMSDMCIDLATVVSGQDQSAEVGELVVPSIEQAALNEANQTAQLAVGEANQDKKDPVLKGATFFVIAIFAGAATYLSNKLKKRE